jgi:hypothetical protein
VDIEKNVPLPIRVKPSKYPWAEMQVGDSFLFLPQDGESTRDTQLRACNAASQWGRRHTTRFTVRTLKDGNVRVWRVE